MQLENAQFKSYVSLLALANKPSDCMSILDWRPFSDRDTLDDIITRFDDDCLKSYVKDNGEEYAEKLATGIDPLLNDLSNVYELKEEHFENIEFLLIDSKEAKPRTKELDHVAKRMSACTRKLYRLLILGEKPDEDTYYEYFKTKSVLVRRRFVNSVQSKEELIKQLCIFCDNSRTISSELNPERISPLLSGIGGNFKMLHDKKKKIYIENIPEIMKNVRNEVALKDLSKEQAGKLARTKATNNLGYSPQFYPGNTSVAKNRRKHMSDDVEKMRDISDEDLTALLGHRAPGSDYPSAHPPLSEMGEPDCSVRDVVEPTPGAAAGDRIRYSQFSDSMYNAPSVPYWRSYHAAINFRGVDPGTLSGRQVNEMRERDMEEYTKRQAETEMTDWGLAGLRGCTVHGHSLRLQEDGTMFDMLDRRRLEGGVIVMDKDQVGVPIDRKVNLGKPMSEAEAAKRTTIYRVDNVSFRSDKEVIEHVQRVWELRTRYGFQPKA